MKNSVISGNGQVASIAANAFMDSLATYRHNCGLPGTSLQLGAVDFNDPKKENIDDGISKLMVLSEAIPLIVKAISVPISLQVIAHLDVHKISVTPFLAQDSIFSSLLSRKDAPSKKKVKMSSEQAKSVLVDMLRLAMELQASEKLGMFFSILRGWLKILRNQDTNEPLTSCGADSIAFAQIKGQVLNELGVDVPVMYLSDDYTINDMIIYIVETYSIAV